MKVRKVGENLFSFEEKIQLRKGCVMMVTLFTKYFLVKLTPTHLLLQQNAHITESMTREAKSMLWMITSSETNIRMNFLVFVYDYYDYCLEFNDNWIMIIIF